MTVAIIADIVGSRRQPDRDALQQQIEDAAGQSDRLVPGADQPWRPTVGDELQAVYGSLGRALRATLVLQLAAPDDVECRFGIGYGGVVSVASTREELQDGPGWWAARQAIEHVHSLARRRVRSARTWFGAGVGAPREIAAITGLVNSYLVARDHMVGEMNGRARRLTLGRMRGDAQKDLADAEGISQSAVSQSLSKAGAPALMLLLDEIDGVEDALLGRSQ
ncbi:SatD family protein [Microbacterium sp. JZ31]|uniref:SatD family protein n=1 Tax=Microbacterium sp. JZ31 TaxID=1906274 RepID=UPI001931FBF4|nr:SatD family protein [Microbacterium sp. JZ31]